MFMFTFKWLWLLVRSRNKVSQEEFMLHLYVLICTQIKGNIGPALDHHLPIALNPSHWSLTALKHIYKNANLNLQWPDGSLPLNSVNLRPVKVTVTTFRPAKPGASRSSIGLVTVVPISCYPPACSHLNMAVAGKTALKTSFLTIKKH